MERALIRDRVVFAQHRLGPELAASGLAATRKQTFTTSEKSHAHMSAMGRKRKMAPTPEADFDASNYTAQTYQPAWRSPSSWAAPDIVTLAARDDRKLYRF